MKNIVSEFNYEEHKQRLINLKMAEMNVVTYSKKRMITDYIPGQFIYKNGNPGLLEEDEKLFSYLKDCGVGILQLWSRWYDGTWQGLDMYNPRNAEKTNKFLELAHKYGLKVLPYTATNFYERTDEHFNPGWAFSKDFDLVECDYHLAHCSPNSPGWRAHIMHQLTKLLDNFDFDGIYNDTGYIRKSDYPHTRCSTDIGDDIIPFKESREFDGGMEDMMALIYSEVKRRNGIYKIHKDGADKIHTKEKIYDYIWVGEGVKSIDSVRERTKVYEPYVVPDFNFKTDNEAERYLNTIPFMQFPVLRDGTTGIVSDDAAVPDTELAMKWLALYNKMATEGAWYYMDAEAPGLVKLKGLKTMVSLFVNLEFYMVLANFSDEDDSILLNGEYVLCDPVKGEIPINGEFVIPARNLAVVRRKNEIIKESDALA